MPNPNRRGKFQRTLAAAVADISEHGFDSSGRVQFWVDRLREAAEESLVSEAQMDEALRRSLGAVYRRLVERGEIARHHPGVSKFTIQHLTPQMRVELDKRVMASANLIRLNRQNAIAKTLQRFEGWSTSIPKGGSKATDKTEVKEDVRKALAGLSFVERRVAIDQGHKLTAAISEVVATGGGAIAAKWNSHWRQANYDYREDHRERDGKIYLLRASWAVDRGFVKPGGAGWWEDMTKPGEEINCFPGDSRVPFADGVEKAYRRWYGDELTEIVTASGKTLSATPNHPVLTVNGWLAIGSLNEGDYVVETAEQSFNVPEQNEYKTIPLISEIFGTLRECGIETVREGQFDQFHGDGSDSNVDVVDAARPLTFGGVPETSIRIGGDWLERGEQFGFSVPTSITAAVGAFGSYFNRICAAGSRFVGCLDQSLAPLYAFAGHSDQVGFGASSQRYTETASQSTSRNAQAIGETQKAFPFDVGLTRVIKVKRWNWSGHVYNLQTTKGWYIVNGIITHNCRCYATWLYALRDLPSEMLTKKGREALEQARAAA